jgi:dUTPase
MKLFIDISNITDETIIAYYKTLEQNNSTRTDSGIDIPLPEDNVIVDYELINLKIKCWTPDGSGYFLAPRSSISKTSYMMQNSIGIIDNGYTGELKMPLVFVIDKDKELKKVDNILNQYKNRVAYFIMGYGFFAGNLPLIGLGYILKELTLQNYYEIGHKFKKGERYAQIVAPDLKPIQVEIVDKLPIATARGSGGFGSTGLSVMELTSKEIAEINGKVEPDR